MKNNLSLIIIIFVTVFVLFSCDLPLPDDYEPPDTRTLPVPEWVINKGAEYDLDTMGINPRSIWRYDYRGESVFYVPAFHPDGFGLLYEYYGGLMGAAEPEKNIIGYHNYVDFADSATNGRIVWENVTQPNLSRSEDHAILNVILDYFEPDSGYLCVRSTSFRYFMVESINNHFQTQGYDYSQATLTSLALKNYDAHIWNADSLNPTIVLINNETYDSLYTAGGWPAFETLYPGENGLMDFTLPGVDSTQTEAIVEMQWRTGNGGGSCLGILLKKGLDLVWQITEVRTIALIDYWG